MGKEKKYKGVCLTYFKKLKYKAEKRKIAFNITLEMLGDLWEKQPICPYTGFSLIQYCYKERKCFSASLDRIDSSKGYEEDNIQWVYKPINKMKSNLVEAEFRRILELIIENGIKNLHK